MNWFKKIFSQNEQQNESFENENFRQLFVDENPPQEMEEEETEEKVDQTNKINKLEKFLNNPFFDMGYKDGYEGHSSELRDICIENIKTEFCEVIDRMVEIQQSEFESLRIHLSEIKTFGEEYRQPILIKADQIKKQMDRLDDGLVMKPILRYKEGFIRGLKNYQKEKLLNSHSGFFND